MQRPWLYHACRVAKFQGVHCLDMLFPESLGAEQLQVFFVGLKGERTQVRCAQPCCHAQSPAASLCIPCQPIPTPEQIHSRCTIMRLPWARHRRSGLQRKREAVTAVYELKPMADASKVPGTQGNTWNMGT